MPRESPSLRWKHAPWVGALGTFLALAAGPACARAQSHAKADVIIHGETIVVDVAESPEQQERGLSGRARLAPGEGMLFVYADAGSLVFWMRDMLIPIDIVWLSNHRVVHIEASVPPPRPGTALRELPTYRAGQPANFVLELAAGRSRELGLKIGDRVEFRFR